MKFEISKDWIMEKAKKEAGQNIEVGAPAREHPAQRQLEGDIYVSLTSYRDFLVLWGNLEVNELKASIKKKPNGNFAFCIEHDIPRP